ncbi:caspase-8 Dredd [Cochliomyia hominivorax]
MSSSKQLNELEKLIEQEDLPFIETDLNFSQLVSLGFLLYADDSKSLHFILQKLIILSQQPPLGQGLKQLGKPASSDILLNYAKLNPSKWQKHIVEALAIIKAKKVLRKLGFNWQQLMHYYLPHVAEISVNIHPLLKALYAVCERLTIDQSYRLITYINDKYKQCQELRFYDSSHLEVFLLNWLTKDVITLGSKQMQDSNVQILIEYFKFNDMLELKDLLVFTINQNIDNNEDVHKNVLPNDNIPNTEENSKDSGVSMSHDNNNDSNCNKNDSVAKSSNIKLSEQPKQQSVKNLEEEHDKEHYAIKKQSAGYVLIINQSKFYYETDPKYKNLIPPITEAIPQRQGTNVDRDNLKQVFSSFGYKPIIFENLTHLEILHHIRETVKKSLLKDSLIICILSHGMEGVIFGSNSVPVSIDEIKTILTADTLNGKPKMLIIQACQRNICGNDMVKNSLVKEDFSPDAYADMLIALASMPGTEALRHTEHGSWFIESLCNCIKKLNKSKHMLDILTAVINDISRRRGDRNQVMLPFTSSTLRKEFFLPSN